MVARRNVVDHKNILLKVDNNMPKRQSPIKKHSCLGSISSSPINSKSSSRFMENTVKPKWRFRQRLQRKAHKIQFLKKFKDKIGKQILKNDKIQFDYQDYDNKLLDLISYVLITEHNIHTVEKNTEKQTMHSLENTSKSIKKTILKKETNIKGNSSKFLSFIKTLQSGKQQVREECLYFLRPIDINNLPEVLNNIPYVQMYESFVDATSEEYQHSDVEAIEVSTNEENASNADDLNNDTRLINENVESTDISTNKKNSAKSEPEKKAETDEPVTPTISPATKRQKRTLKINLKPGMLEKLISPKPTELQCLFCSKYFSQLSVFQGHRLAHSGEVIIRLPRYTSLPSHLDINDTEDVHKKIITYCKELKESKLLNSQSINHLLDKYLAKTITKPSSDQKVQDFNNEASNDTNVSIINTLIESMDSRLAESDGEIQQKSLVEENSKDESRRNTESEDNISIEGNLHNSFEEELMGQGKSKDISESACTKTLDEESSKNIPEAESPVIKTNNNTPKKSLRKRGASLFQQEDTELPINDDVRMETSVDEQLEPEVQKVELRTSPRKLKTSASLSSIQKLKETDLHPEEPNKTKGDEQSAIVIGNSDPKESKKTEKIDVNSGKKSILRLRRNMTPTPSNDDAEMKNNQIDAAKVQEKSPKEVDTTPDASTINSENCTKTALEENGTKLSPKQSPKRSLRQRRMSLFVPQEVAELPISREESSVDEQLEPEVQDVRKSPRSRKSIASILKLKETDVHSKGADKEDLPSSKEKENDSKEREKIVNSDNKRNLLRLRRNMCNQNDATTVKEIHLKEVDSIPDASASKSKNCEETALEESGNKSPLQVIPKEVDTTPDASASESKNCEETALEESGNKSPLQVIPKEVDTTPDASASESKNCEEIALEESGNKSPLQVSPERTKQNETNEDVSLLSSVECTLGINPSDSIILDSDNSLDNPPIIAIPDEPQIKSRKNKNKAVQKKKKVMNPFFAKTIAPANVDSNSTPQTDTPEENDSSQFDNVSSDSSEGTNQPAENCTSKVDDVAHPVEETLIPSAEETQIPSAQETQIPSAEETQIPSAQETQIPSAEETQIPSAQETQIPSAEETQIPSADESTVQESMEMNQNDVHTEEENEQLNTIEDTLQSSLGDSTAEDIALDDSPDKELILSAPLLETIVPPSSLDILVGDPDPSCPFVIVNSKTDNIVPALSPDTSVVDPTSSSPVVVMESDAEEIVPPLSLNNTSLGNPTTFSPDSTPEGIISPLTLHDSLVDADEDEANCEAPKADVLREESNREEFVIDDELLYDEDDNLAPDLPGDSSYTPASPIALLPLPMDNIVLDLPSEIEENVKRATLEEISAHLKNNQNCDSLTEDLSHIDTDMENQFFMGSKTGESGGSSEEEIVDNNITNEDLMNILLTDDESSEDFGSRKRKRMKSSLVDTTEERVEPKTKRVKFCTERFVLQDDNTVATEPIQNDVESNACEM